MKYKPSTLEMYIAELPEYYQRIALEAIAEEHRRWERKEFTEDELYYREAIQIASAKLANHMNNIILESFKGE